MEHIQYKKYEELLRSELIPALGCTEPGAVGYAAAKACDVLECFPEHLEMYCSANIIKNVKSVNVPNSDGMKGIEAAAVLGAIAGMPEDSLEIFRNITKEQTERAKELIANDFCDVKLQEGEGNLYIHAIAFAGEDKADVIIKGTHTNIIFIGKDDDVIFSKTEDNNKAEEVSADFMTVADIVEYAATEKLDILKDLMHTQVKVNSAIAEEGMKNDYGSNIGKTLISAYGDDVKVRAKAKAAAGSDARMGGSPLPVVINSGSGNQGITITVPVVEYAKELNASEDQLYRSLAISNLISIHIKKNIGKLSAFCGAVSAACGSGAGIAYMNGGDYEDICNTITSTLANVGGIICDGAKASCAAKIAASVDAAILGYEMSKNDESFRPGDGIVAEDIEETIKNFGIVGCEGMRETDLSIMKLMLDC